jgi:RNA 2',3'-cyclic 3'-phosphodiesterase
VLVSRDLPPKLRLFLAVRPEPAPLAALDQALTAARAALPGDPLRWAATDKLHVTLRFFGSVPRDSLESIGAVCRPVCATTAPFTMALEGSGAFPSARRGSVLWIGITQGGAELRALAAAFNPPLDALSFEREAREFKPHLTVARAKQPLPLTAAVAAVSSVSIRTRVTELLLVRSVLGGPSAHYETLERYPFAV